MESPYYTNCLRDYRHCVGLGSELNISVLSSCKVRDKHIIVEYSYLLDVLSLLHQCYGKIPVTRIHTCFALRQAQDESVDFRIFRLLHK